MVFSGVTLSQRATTDGHFLHCSHCMWTTNDEGLGTRAKAESWTLPANPMQAHFNEINSYLKNLSTKPIARTTSDLPNTARKSLSNMSSVVSDK